MKKIISQIIVLTKNIFLNRSDGTQKGMEQFFVGKREPFHLSRGIGISWRYTQFTYKTVENLSFLINGEIEGVSGCDHKTIQSVIRKTLQEICVDRNIFDGDLVCFGGKDTLFECRTENDTNKYGTYIFDAILGNVRNSISLGCVIYTAPRITGKSFTIDCEKIHVIHKDDNAKWDELIELGYHFDEWSPLTGELRNGHKTVFSGKDYDYIFVTETEGTNQGNKFSSSLKFRKLFSVISAHVECNYRLKVMARPYSMCMQVPHIRSQDKSFTLSEIGELYPYYSHDVEIKSEHVSTIKQWYKEEQVLTAEQRNRIEKCAHFINKGMNSSDIESYVHYFVALDALYGKKGLVSKSIKQGISCLPNSSHWNEKISWLFELRNELVHGGSRYIEEWPKYMRYYRHFSAEPAIDIEKLAFHALASAPSFFHESSKVDPSDAIGTSDIGAKSC
ncbi:hypothetical protein CTM88_20700 [Photobacterium aquimaris]|uniref:Uncharacterized protein n=1 Tax=Photobacterium aquimaris TaxID=512643 RepID=A0A2T3IEJ5_9GAMM|nr:HEPN domain-containing protein [Photobacterium aquimaris]OBU19982.1 hypothetical protein AYY20_16755 [Photobacterium aquimaris]PSU21620.1 hypothetical protein CTM88_20700 [Photobacterium aquimaris]